MGFAMWIIVNSIQLSWRDVWDVFSFVLVNSHATMLNLWMYDFDCIWKLGWCCHVYSSGYFPPFPCLILVLQGKYFGTISLAADEEYCSLNVSTQFNSQNHWTIRLNENSDIYGKPKITCFLNQKNTFTTNLCWLRHRTSEENKIWSLP